MQKVKSIIFNIILAVAMFFLAVGLVNFIGVFNADDFLESNEQIIATTRFAENKKSKGTLTEIPKVVAKPVFERLLKNIPDDIFPPDVSKEWIVEKFSAYYSIRDLENGFYVFDRIATEREITEILGYWNEYIGWSDEDYLKMLLDYNMLDSKFVK